MNVSNSPSTSLTLLGAMRSDSGRNEAWSRFVELYRPLLRRWLARHGLQEAQSDDLMGTVFLKVLQGLPGFDPEKGGFRSWLRAILKHALLDEVRRRSRRPGDAPRGGSEFSSRLEQVAESESDSLADDFHELLLEQDRILDEVKNRVGEKAWQAFWQLRIGDGRSAAEIGQELGMSIGAVHQAAHRVAKMLRQEGERRQNPSEARP